MKKKAPTLNLPGLNTFFKSSNADFSKQIQTLLQQPEAPALNLQKQILPKSTNFLNWIAKNQFPQNNKLFNFQNIKNNFAQPDIFNLLNQSEVGEFKETMKKIRKKQ